MTKQLQDQAKSLGEEHMRNEEKIKNANDQFRQLLPNISDCQKMAQRRVDTLEKKRRLEKKIACARYLLCSTTLTIKEIAFKLGYCDPFYLSFSGSLGSGVT